MPSTDGPAKGLRNTVCICRPLTASPAPAAMAVSACGSRAWKMMFCQISDSLLLPIRMLTTLPTGMSTVPIIRLATSSTTMTGRSRIIEKAAPAPTAPLLTSPEGEE